MFNSLRPIFRYSGLNAEVNPSFEVTTSHIKVISDLSYYEQWSYLFSNNFYNIKFPDNSIFTFQYGQSPSYRYIECPLDVPSYEDFLRDMGMTNAKDKFSEANRSDYSLTLLTANMKSHINPIRYDLDRKSYREGIHPAAHLHIGLDNEIRIGLEREMTAVAFLLFVLRQRYPLNWEKLIHSSFGVNLERLIRQSLPFLGSVYRARLDRREVYLV